MKDKPSVLDSLLPQLQNHATLISSGIDNEQALKIAFGDDEASDVLEAMKEIEKETSKSI